MGLNLINSAHEHPLCIHYIEQKDWTAGLDAGGIWEIPFTKVNQLHRPDCTGEGPSIGVLSLWLLPPPCIIPPLLPRVFHNVSGLESLHLEGNRLAEVPSTTFIPLTSLRQSAHTSPWGRTLTPLHGAERSQLSFGAERSQLSSTFWTLKFSTTKFQNVIFTVTWVWLITFCLL